ncbi:hypothetical protein D3C87_1850250 [compost metagenome]
MPGTQSAVVELDAQLDGLANELLRVESRGLVDHIDRIARHLAQSLLGMGSQGEQFLPLGRRQLQQAFGLAQRLAVRGRHGVSD